jgi:DNA-binding HxlR family transcriptional regulator
VGGRRSGGLLARVRWPDRGAAVDAPGRTGDGRAAAKDGKRPCMLDWRAVQAQLTPVRHRWDLAILCNLAEDVGSRPGNILAAINAQTEPGRQLSPQVLSGRLRELEGRSYIRHEDLSVMPLHRVYYLRSPGQRLIEDLGSIARPARVLGVILLSLTARASVVQGERVCRSRAGGFLFQCVTTP